MSASDDLIQAAKDMDFHGANYWSNASLEARERAKKASRELFPPMAKALVFDPPYRSKRFAYTAGGHLAYEVVPTTEGFYALSHQIEWHEHCNTEAEALAKCEQHHQQNFKENLA